MKLLSPQLLAFISIAEHKTVHAAANDLHLTQTAVTQRIKTLEQRLSTSLFIRTRRGMILTSEGESLLRYCYQVQELEGEALSGITKAGIEQNVSLCIAGPTTIMRTRVIPSCYPIIKKFPRLLMQFEINDTDDIIKLLRHGHAQLAVIGQHLLSDEIEYKELKPEHYVLVASHHWRKRSLQDILQHERIIDFNPSDQMTYQYLQYYDLDHLTNKDRYFSNQTDVLVHMIENEIGYGVLPLEFAKPYLANKKIVTFNDGKTFPYSLSLAWYPRNQHPSYFSAVISTCK